MADHKVQAPFSITLDDVQSSKSALAALELKIAEQTGLAEYMSQKIANSQGQVERLEKDVEDLRRLKLQAEIDLHAHEELNTQKRREQQTLQLELQKQETTLKHQQELIRSFTEAIEVAESRSYQAVESAHAAADEKVKSIQNDVALERDRLNIELEAHRTHTQEEIQRHTEEMIQARKKQLRALEIEMQDSKRRGDDALAKLQQEGRIKNEALIKATEATALEVHRESETAARRLLAEANQKAADVIRTAQHEAEEIRRRTHNAEVSFLKEKNSGLAELKLMVNNAKEEAQSIISTAMKEASEIQYKVELENEARITSANTKISQQRKTAEKETLESIEKAKAEFVKQQKQQETLLARKVKEAEEYLAQERKRLEDEARQILNSARERAQAIVETANNEKTYKFEELKALESSMFQSARQSASVITHDAEKIAVNIVEEARNRVKTIEKTVESILSKASEEANKIRASADAYSERIKRDLPDPAHWEAALAKISQQEQERLQALIEPTVKNYLKAIDMAISDIFLELPTKFQSNKVIQDFAQAIASIQHRKNLVNFNDLIPRLSAVQAPTSHPPIKKSS